MSQPERRQYVIDTDESRMTFTARPVIEAAGNSQIDVSFTDVEDFRQIPRTELGSGDQQ
ncbi:hypothetical protein [Mycolicibacterium peregrinum]|uniref:hypothetical protein n=1 Tax=Mycolicibacterium peregrinum TaxID=43304 RepID=UPI003AAD7A50